jgi:hypothetical protein
MDNGKPNMGERFMLYFIGMAIGKQSRPLKKIDLLRLLILRK